MEPIWLLLSDPLTYFELALSFYALPKLLMYNKVTSIHCNYNIIYSKSHRKISHNVLLHNTDI